MNFEEMVQKAVNVEAKASLRSNIMVQDSDAHCPRGYCPSYNNFLKVQTQGLNYKNLSHSKRSKFKDSKSAPPHDDTAEPAKKKGEKKKRFQKHRQERTGERKK